MALDIFTHKVGEGHLVWPTDPERQAELAVSMLDAVQTIVDVLVDEGVTYSVGFADLGSAYTDYKRKRIVISAKPMMEGGRTFDEVAAILTGFAVHEIGHTKLSAKAELVAEWPTKVTPHRLANILEDVRLEDWTIRRFRGLTDVFVPTLDWVAKATCPTHELTYGKTVHDRLNFAGQAIRYEPFVTFGQDAETQSQLRWWREWGAVTADTTNAQLIELVREGIAHIKAGAEYEPEPPTTDEGGDGTPGQSDESDEDGEPNQGNPDADDQPTEGGDGDSDDDTEGGDGESDETDTEGEDGDSNGDDDESDEDSDEGGSATDADPLDDDGEADADGEGETTDSDGDSTEGDSDDGEPGDTDEDGPEGDQYHDGQMDEGETLDREETDSPMGDGAGGSGKAIAPDSDEDEGLDKDKLDRTLDDLNDNEGDVQQQHEQAQLERNVQEERTTARIDAGAFGKMKVKVVL